MRRFNQSSSSVLLAAACCFLLSCASDDHDVDMGTIRVEATIDPAQPVVGQNMMHIDLYDADDLRVEGAMIMVDPQMPEHGHGSTDVPSIEDMGGGSYQAFPVTLTMPGMWEITVHASIGDEHGMRVFEYQAQ